MINIIKSILFKITFYPLSYIVPKDKKLLIFQNVLGKSFRGNPKAIYLYVKKNLPNYKIKYFASSDENKSNNFKGEQKYKLSFRTAWMVLRANYIFVDTTYYATPNLSTLMGNFNIIQVYAGTVIKKYNLLDNKKIYPLLTQIALRKELQNYKLVLATSEYSKKATEEAFESKNVRVLGYPRNDIFFDEKTYSMENLREKLNVKKYKKVFLYCPTHRGLKVNVSPFNNKDLNKLNKVLIKNNWVLFTVAHRMTNKINNEKDDFSNIINVNDKINDFQELLPLTDVMISDYSGAICDFLLTGKPIIYFVFDLEEYYKYPGIYFDFEKECPGPIVKTTSDLIEVISNSEKIKIDKIKYEKFNNLFNKYKDGNSTKRLLNKLKINK